MKLLKRLLAVMLTVCMLSGILIPNSLTVVHADSAASGGGGAGVGGGNYGVPGNPDGIETEAVNLQHGTGVVLADIKSGRIKLEI